MLYYASDLENYRLHATDGEMGKIQGLYFDDEKWVVRYVSVDTRKWLPGRHVLLSPSSFTRVDTESQEVTIASDKDTVRESPSLEESEPFTHNYEFDLTNYWGWTPYWSGTYLWGNHDTLVPNAPVTAADVDYQNTEGMDSDRESVPNEVRHTLKEVDEMREQFIIHANDGKIGWLDDFLIDSENWKLRYLVIRSGEEFQHDYYYLSPDWIQSIDWVDNNAYVALDKEIVKNGPGYNSKMEITRTQEQELYSSYQKPKYWEL